MWMAKRDFAPGSVVSDEVMWRTQERMEAPRRKLDQAVARVSLRELELLRADWADAQELEAKIEEEQQHLAFLFHDLKEQEGILELNKRLQLDLLTRKHEERLTQLETYRKLKDSEERVTSLISDFNARLELKRNLEVEKKTHASMQKGEFAKIQGGLHLPVKGATVLQGFGRGLDPKSGLYVFKKGVDLAVKAGQEVHSIFNGKVAFAGELPEYGRVVIVDHGDHFYSICANLGSVSKNAGEVLARGDVMGLTDSAGRPLYFEIRSKNLPVNPLQWVSK
jgi:septal ring factor EnvC (AmiA/AmiB activator)